MEKRVRKIKSSKIILIIFAMAFIIAGGFFLYKTAYEKGKTDGRKNYESETAGLVKNLATAVSEKSSDFSEIQKTLGSLPSELAEDTINSYLESLEKIQLKNAEAKEILAEYKNSWQSMKTIYETKDNEKIQTEFETLKSEAAKTAEKLQTLYDDDISSALEKL